MSRVINISVNHEVGKFVKNLKLQNVITLKVSDMGKKLLTHLIVGFQMITEIKDHVKWCID